jgi:hypothetical protein
MPRSYCRDDRQSEQCHSVTVGTITEGAMSRSYCRDDRERKQCHAVTVGTITEGAMPRSNCRDDRQRKQCHAVTVGTITEGAMQRSNCRDNKQVFSESLDCENVQVGRQRNKCPWLQQNNPWQQENMRMFRFDLQFWNVSFCYCRSDRLWIRLFYSPKFANFQ